jgi:hypothetical protein
VNEGAFLDPPSVPAHGQERSRPGTTYQEREKNRKKAMP